MHDSPSAWQINQKAYDEWAPTYDVDRPPHTYLEEPYLLDLINVQEGDLVLDAACGTGRYAQIFARCGAQVTGCDISQQMLQEAKSKLPGVPFDQVDLHGPLPYRDSSFSKVVCSLAIGHLSQVDGFFAEVARLLTPSGTFVFSTVHPEMDWSTYERSNPSAVDVNAQAKVFAHSAEYLIRFLAKAGLKFIRQVDVCADTRIKEQLTPRSFRQQTGRKFVMLISAR